MGSARERLARLGAATLRESGLPSVRATGRDAALVILARACRMFCFGSSSLILALFFAELGFSDERIGLFMTLTLLGDVVLSLGATLVADRVGRRRTLFAGSLFMILSGIAFGTSENYWVLLGAAVIGVISATGGDFGPFRAIEESVLSELTTPETRADVLVWYVTLASLGSSVGTEVSGRIIEALRSRDGWTLVDAYHCCFLLYAAGGVINMACSAMLSERCELRKKEEPVETSETEALLGGGSRSTEEEVQQEPKARKSWVSQLSRETLSIMAVLWFLLMVDSLADGMANMTFVTYFLDGKFGLSKAALGDIVSASYFLSSLSTIFSGPLSRYLGLVNTMVFTHIPSSAAVLLFPLAPSVPLTVVLLLVRLGLNNMDQAPRAALIAAVVKSEERTAAMGITGTLRTLASATGPTITGFLAGNGRFWIAFVVAGALRLAYDLGLFLMFINIKLYRHERPEGPAEPQERREHDVLAQQSEP